MKKLRKEIVLSVGWLNGRQGRMVMIALVIALFVISAGAPNATIGIGK
jgi:hypothetical protein